MTEPPISLKDIKSKILLLNFIEDQREATEKEREATEKERLVRILL